MIRQVVAALILTVSAPALAAPINGIAAPDFAARAADGTLVRLSDLRGKTVVLEWTNSGCPFVRAHYDSGTMQQRQREAARLGVVWLSINSGAPGKQGHVDGPGARAEIASGKAAPAHYLLDGDGKIGRLYDAKTATPWAKNAITAVLAGKAPSPAITRPYGCSVKYAG